MSNKPLIETNPYLKDPARRKELLYTTAVSSTAVEGVHAAVIKELESLKKLDNPIDFDESEGSDELRK